MAVTPIPNTDVASYVNSAGQIEEADVVSIVSTSASPTYVKGANYTPRGYQQIVSATLATSQALTVPGSATVAIMKNSGNQPIRWRDDGNAPTSTVGMTIDAGDTFTYDGTLSAFRAIRVADGAILDIAYYS